MSFKNDLKYEWEDLKDMWRLAEIDWFKVASSLVLLALWIAAISALWVADFGACLTFSVLIIAWKLKPTNE